MKKTFTLLLAAAGMAMGASLEWDGNNIAQLNLEDFKNRDATVVMTVDFSKLDNKDKSQEIFTIIGSDMLHIMGVGMYKNTTEFSSVYGVNGMAGYPTGSGVYKEANIEDVAEAVVVYTCDGKTDSEINNGDRYWTLTGYLYTWNSLGEMLPVVDIVYKKDIKNTELGYLKKDANLVTDIAIFNEVVADPEKLALDFKNASIPEPTTATLSLLALAGLAARRRRK